MPNAQRLHVQVALFWVGSQLKPSSTATQDQYHQFYNEELIPEALNFPILRGPKTIVRYKNETASPGNFPFVALYPQQDFQLMYGPIRDRALLKTRGVPTKAFEGDTAYQHVDFNNHYYRYLYMIESEKKVEADADAYPLTMIADSFNAPEETLMRIREEALFKVKYRLPGPFWKCEHRWLSLVYKLLLGKAPRYLVLHFFNCEHDELGEEFLAAGADECVDRQAYSLLCSQGEMRYPPPADSSNPESSSEESWVTKYSSNKESSGDKQSAPSSTVTALDWILY